MDATISPVSTGGFQSPPPPQRAQTATNSTLFEEQLASLQSSQQPLPLSSRVTQTTSAPKNQTAAATSPQTQDEPQPRVKIARSWRREDAEETTRVQEIDDFSFDDFVDLINPLQHIPLLGTLYRELTGDEIRPAVQVAGSVMYGAATGNVLLSAAAGVASAMIEENGGNEPLVQIASAIFGPETSLPIEPASSEVKTAQAAVTEAPVPAAAPVEKIQVAQTEPLLTAAQSHPVQTPSPNDMTRMGNIIYASPLMRSAARLSAPQASATETKPLPPASHTALDGPTFGAMLQDQAKAKASGNPLPPELIQDMMLMALDKYKTAHTGAPDGTAVP